MSKTEVAFQSSPRTDSVNRNSTASISSGNGEKNYTNDPHPLRYDAWGEPDTTSFHIRGPAYLKDRCKVASEKSAFQLLTTDMIYCPEGLLETGVCGYPKERIQRAIARERETGQTELPEFVFCVNLVVPAKQGGVFHHAIYFGCDDASMLNDENTPFGRLASKFFFGDSDEFRDNTFKLIPRIIEGNILVKKAVGSKPAILGRKIRQVYFKTGRYFEVMVDVNSDSVARKICALALGYAKTMVVDMAFVLEGPQSDMLPERLLGAIRMKNVEFRGRDAERHVCK